MIIYQFQGVTPIIDKNTGNVTSWVIGLRGTDSDDPSYTAYIDATVPVPEDNLKPQSDWADDEIRQFAMDYAIKREYTINPDTNERDYTKQNWFEQIREQIEGQKGAPIRGSAVVL